MSPVKKHILSRKVCPRKSVCLIIKNGVPCTRRVASRGLCSACRNYLTKIGRLEDFALPKQERRKDLRPNPSALEGLCHTTENGVACTAVARRRGLCLRHYAAIWQRDDLDLEDFVIAQRPTRYRRQKKPKPGSCVVREVWAGGKAIDCGEKPIARGLCKRHYRVLQEAPDIMEGVADRTWSERELRIKSHPGDGVCLVVDDGIGCTRPSATKRGVCLLHHQALKKRGLLETLTDPFVAQRHEIARKPAELQVEGYCVLMVNGVSCLNRPKMRGVCSQCLSKIRRLGLDIEALALPKAQARGALERKPRGHLARRVCIVVQDGQPCDHPATPSGFCSRHFKMATRRGDLERLRLTDKQLAALPEVLHLYLDKSVVLDFACHELFDVSGARDSVAIVEAVLSRKVRATVSLDCVRAVYSHIGHRLARSVSERGKGIDEVEAEAAGRKYAGELFFKRNGFWHFLHYSEEQYHACAAGGKLPKLTLEDALEVTTFGLARQECGADILVSADGHISEGGHGVHPSRIVEANPEVFGDSERRGHRAEEIN